MVPGARLRDVGALELARRLEGSLGGPPPVELGEHVEEVGGLGVGLGVEAVAVVASHLSCM